MKFVSLNKSVKIVFIYLCCVSLGMASLDTSPTPSLLKNGGFESEFIQGQPPGFRCSPIDSRSNAKALFELSDDAFTGERALRIERLNTDSGYALWINIPTLKPVSPPRRLLLVYHTKPLKSDNSLSGAYLTWESFTPTWHGACRQIKTLNPNPYMDTWGKNSLLLEQLPGKTCKYFRLRVHARNPGDAILIDNIALYDATEWSSTDVEAMTRWEQQPVDAASINQLPFKKGNILENSGFELGLSKGWSIPGPTPPEQTLMVNSATAHHGKKSVKLDFEAGKRAWLTGCFRPVRVNQSHTLSAWVRASTPETTVTLGFENGYVPEHGAPHACRARKTVTAGKWQRIEVSGVTQTGPANAYGIQISATAPEAGALFIDSVQFEEGPPRAYAPRKNIEAALTAHTTAGISLWDEPIKYRIKVVNHTPEPVQTQLKTEIFDFNDRCVNSFIPKQHSFPAGLTIISCQEKAKVRGSQRLRLYVGQSEAIEDEITLSVIPPIRYPHGNPDSRFGQHVKLKPWELDIARKMGAGWIRMHDVDFCLSWDQAEPKPGIWVWADEKIDLAKKHNLEVLGVLGRVPGWILPKDATGKAARGGWVYPPDLKAWGAYVESVTRHYKGKINVWEIWNEPYGFGVYDGTKYAALAKVAYAAAKRGNPDCRVLGFCTHAGATAFNRDALSGGAMNACDWISYHCYTKDGADAYERGVAVRKALGLNDNKKAVWMTEGMGGYTYSWHSLLTDAVDDPYSRKPGAPKFTAKNSAVTGARAIANILSAGAEKVFWYWSPWESASSIRPDRYSWFEYDGQLKPYAVAYAVAAHFLDSTEPAKRLVIEEKLIACIFNRDSGSIAVVWREDEQEGLIPLPSSINTRLQLFDIMGNPLPTAERKIRVGSQPLYIRASEMNSENLELLLRKSSS